MLTVRGESMIEAGILDGDYILVKKTRYSNEWGNSCCINRRRSNSKNFL